MHKLLIAAGLGTTISSSNNNNKLAARFVLLEMVNEFCETSAQALLVQLGDFAHRSSLTLGTEHLGKLGKALEYTIGRLIENHCTLFLFKEIEASLTAFFLRQEAFEHKLVTW